VREDDAQAVARRFVLEALKQQREEQRHAEDWATRGKKCPIQRPMRDRW
jgi:hypothetical protein